MRIAKVVVPFPLYNIFDYKSIEGVELGSLVEVNFSRLKTIGLVVDLIDMDENDDRKIKTIDKVLEIKSLKKELVDFIRWVADYNIIPIGLVFKNVFSEKYITAPKETNVYSFLSDENKKITPKQEEIVKFLKNNFDKAFAFNELKDICSLNILKTLTKNGIVEEKKIKYDVTNYSINIDDIHLNTLSAEQNNIYNDILELMKENKPILLEGATGSGKTEIYFHLFKKFLKDDSKNQILFLLPEIALTTQFIGRIKSQFACKDVAVWHSNIADGKKQKMWNGIANGEIKIIVGARSALFLPFNKLSIVVVDEEHDGSYKQTENGCYNARDMAIVRAKLNKIPIILGSATPALESLINMENKKYNYVYLKNRFGKAIAPTIDVVDLTKEKLKNDRYLSKNLLENMKTELSKNNQVMLFMNRRGYAPVALCGECGYKFSCPNCSCSLAVHKNYFLCHQCGYKESKKLNCPSCATENSIIFFGPGVEKIEAEAKEYFPNNKIAVITSDTTQNRAETQEIFNKIINNEVDIIIGTQMITKGYDFPKLTLVGVLDADASLFGANFRATERTYQLLTQVVGRAGRRDDASRAIIQSYSPDNLIINALKNNDKTTLFEFEKQSRELINLPPYGKMVMLIIIGKDEMKTYRKAKEIMNILPNNSDNIEVFGPTPAGLYKSNNEFRFKLLIKTKLNINIQKIVLKVLENIKLDNIKMRIDVNPYFIV